MQTIGAKIDMLFELRESKRGLEKQIEELGKNAKELETALLEQMAAEGVTKSTGARATVSVSESVKPNVEDWDSFYGFIHRHKYYHLLERRPSVSGCRELFETKGAIPGVVPFTQRTLRLTSLS